MPDIRMLTASPPISSPPILFKGAPTPLQKQWSIKASPVVAASKNPIRTTLAELMAIRSINPKGPINLGLGDPTGLHAPPPASISAVVETIQKGQDNGYIPGPGTVQAREAIAAYHKRWDGVSYTAGEVALTHGVGHALDTIFNILVTPHPVNTARSNILLPRPGFAQYPMLLGSLGGEARYYDCVEENNWEIDLDQLDELCDENTKAILITNPSNPCGSNFSREHLTKIVRIADKHKVPIIADEIYGHITWDAPFVPLASISTTVPVITLSGLSKRFLLPGWRIGWMCLHDPLAVAGDIKDGMVTWANRFMGPSSVVQASLGAILETPDEWYASVLSRVRVNADIMFNAISKIKGLRCQQPQGALYMLVKLDPEYLAETDDIAVCKQLQLEQNLFLLPGSCFDAPGYIRLVIASPADVMEEVAVRLADFCASRVAA